MIKKSTGKKFTPEEFRKLSQCVRCGKASPITYGEACESCKALSIPNCDICEIILRTGKHTFYTYDNREDVRDGEFLASKNSIREFTHDKIYSDFYDPSNLCHDCRDWENRISNTCTECGEEFVNNKEHYKLFGNCCLKCQAKYE